MRILSWNVNGIRAVQRKGFLEWLERESPDILCVQETKAHPDQLDMILLQPPGYHAVWYSCERKKGYSGVATFAQTEPLKVSKGLGIERFDCEGRFLLTEFRDFVLLNIYFPNGQSGAERLQYKLDFYDEVLKFESALRKKGKPVITSGDYNTAHREIDLARPKENEKTSGFLPEERAWIDRWIEAGHIDIFRHFHKEPGNYTYWDQKSRARERNVGWRIDYHFITPDLLPAVREASIMPEVIGSDHCPVTLELDL